MNMKEAKTILTSRVRHGKERSVTGKLVNAATFNPRSQLGARSQAASLVQAQSQFVSLTKHIARAEAQLVKARQANDHKRVAKLTAIISDSKAKAFMLLDKVEGYYNG